MPEPHPSGGDGRDREAPAVFRDRADAGRRLARMLSPLREARPVVLGLPRGGVPVAAEVARALDAPLDVILVRKLGTPRQPELAVGAIGEGDIRVLNEEVRRATAIDEQTLASIEARERAALDRMAGALRRGRPPVQLRDRTVVVVDDGIATGSTAKAACQVARARGAARAVLASPVIPFATLPSLRGVADDVVCVTSPEPFFAIGQWYVDFAQTRDEEVVELLADAVAREGAATAVQGAGARIRDVRVPIPLVSGDSLPGQLAVPPQPLGVVVFAHGSSSSRFSPRNQVIARRLHRARLGTLLFDLLTPAEADGRAHVFDVELLAERLVRATAAVHALESRLPVGYFGASTGAAAALLAAAEPRAQIAAVVGRGGRPDLAGARLRDVRSPTLLVVGGRDPEVLRLNRRALDAMVCPRELVLIEGATHLFEEPGALDRVGELAAGWFSAHFPEDRAVR